MTPLLVSGPALSVLSSGGSAALWCHDVVHRTQNLRRVDDCLRAVCDTTGRPPRIASGPLLGTTLSEVLDRPQDAFPLSGDPAVPRRHRAAPGAGERVSTPRTGVLTDAPPGERRAEIGSPPPPGRLPRRSIRSDGPAGGSAPSSSTLPAPGVRVPVSRLRALAGPDSFRPARPSEGDVGGTVGAVRDRLRPTRRAKRTSASLTRLPDAPATAEAAVDDLVRRLARRLARRLGASADDDLASMRRAAPRVSPPDITETHLRELAGLDARPGLVTRTGDAEPEHTGRAAPPRHGQPTGPDRGPKARSARDSRTAAPPDDESPHPRPDVVTGVGLDVPASTLRSDPAVDLQGVGALSRFAETSARPPRLVDGPLADDTPAARGSAWTGSAPATPDVRAATAAAGLSQPDLELVMARILDDVARRHGIEV